MDLALLESVSTDASAVTVSVIQPLQNQTSLWGSHEEVSIANARKASSASGSVAALQIFCRESLVPRKTGPLKPFKSCNMGLRNTNINLS